jgi:hypothetical protein
MASGYSYISKPLFEYYQQTANTYIPSIPTIRLSEGDSYGGDHMPLNIYEYPSLYIGDVEYMSLHPCYHKPCDTIGIGVDSAGVNSLILAKAFVQVVLSAAAELANAWLPPQNLSACSSNDKITVSWDSGNEATSYKLFKNKVLLDEITENFYADTNVEIGKKYEYYVIAVKNGQQSASSNKDSVTFVKSLQLPYSNDFSDKHGFEQSDWILRNIDSKNSLCNTASYGTYPDNYLSIAELDWFSIPSDTKNISIRFKWQGILRGIMYNPKYEMLNSNAGLSLEVTNDRKTWHKLARISGDVSNWNDCEFSLNNYIGSDFFQVRFRLESNGAEDRFYPKIGFITDIEIGDWLGIDDAKKNFPYISSFHFMPNPANTSIHITTDLQTPYHIAIYDMAGKVVFAQDNFNDGQLDVACLSKGNYLIVASTKQHRFARKLVIE